MVREGFRRFGQGIVSRGWRTSVAVDLRHPPEMRRNARRASPIFVIYILPRSCNHNSLYRVETVSGPQ